MANPKTYSNQSVNLTPSASSKHSKIIATASSSIMTNYEPSRSVTANHKIKPVEDVNGNPIVFSVGTNNHLYVVLRDTKSSSGWAQYDVTEAIASDWEVASFDTYRYANGTFVLAVALTKDSTVRFFTTTALSNDPTAAFWSNFSAQLVERPNTISLKNVSKIILGESDNSGIPIIIANATTDGTNYDRYLVNGDTKSSDNLWTLWPLPQNAHTKDGSNPIVDVALGKLSDLGLTGTYTLYYVGNDLQLTFDSVQKFNGQVISHAMTIPDGAQALATVVGDSNGNTELYVAGNGIYRFPVNGQGNSDQAIKIANSLQASAQTELEALADDNNIALWFLDEGVLSYIHGTRTATPTWTTPMPIAKDVGQIAAIRNTVLKTNEIFDVDADNNLNYYYQDPSTTIWRKNPIALADVGNAVPFKCYTTTVHLEDENGVPINTTVSLSASSWIYATVNGSNHILDKDTDISLTTDASGAITIITKVDTASSPIIGLKSGEFKEYIDVNPQNIVNENLKGFTSSSSVSSATTQNGDKVLPDNSKVSADQLANTFKTLTNASDAANGNTISVRTSNTINNTVDASALNQSHTGEKTFGVQNMNSLQPKMVTGNAALSLVPDNIKLENTRVTLTNSRTLTSDTGDAIEAFFGDVWNAITSGLEKVGSWVLNVVEEGVQFVVHLANGIATFILDTIEKIYEVLSWVLDQIEMGLEKLIQWLGQLLGWDDIITCHKIMANGINQTLSWLAEEPQKIKTHLDAFFNDAAKTLTGQSLPSDISSSSYTKAASDTKDKQSDEVKSNDNYTKSPAGSFAKYHIVHSGPANSNESVTSALTQALKDFMGTLETVGKDVYDTTKTIVMDIFDGIANGNMTVDQIFKKVMDDAILGTFKTIEDFANGMLDVLTDVINAVKAVLNYSIDIPFISGLYKLISGDDHLTILNVFSLIVSVPVVTLMKITTGTTPFANGTLGLDNTSQSPDDFMKLIAGGSSEPAARAMAMTTTDARSNESISAGVLYSQIGGGVFIIAEAINDILAVMGAAGATLGSFAKWIRVLLQAIMAGGSFPAVQDSAQGWRIVKWFLGLGTLTVLFCSAVDPTYGPAAGFLGIIYGIVGLVLAFGIPITVSINGNAYQITMAWIAFIGSLGAVTGAIAAAIAKFDFEPESKEIIAFVSGVGFTFKVVYDLYRELIVVIQDASNDYKPFYA